MEFSPTYLYIKQHAVTGLLYFGKTTETDPIKYLGSGKYWHNHIKKHGTKHIVTLWYELFTNKEELIAFAIKFSKELDIVKSKSWANLVEENGIDGAPRHHTQGMTGKTHSNETKQLLREQAIGKPKSEEHRLAISKASQNRSEEHKRKLKDAQQRRRERLQQPTTF